MKSKQTAVEWLIHEIIAQDWWYLPESMKQDIIEQAKAMEKEQIIEAIKLTIEKEYYEQTWANCGSRNHMAEEYYNETFKSE